MYNMLERKNHSHNHLCSVFGSPKNLSFKFQHLLSNYIARYPINNYHHSKKYKYTLQIHSSSRLVCLWFARWLEAYRRSCMCQWSPKSPTDASQSPTVGPPPPTCEVLVCWVLVGGWKSHHNLPGRWRFVRSHYFEVDPSFLPSIFLRGS